MASRRLLALEAVTVGLAVRNGLLAGGFPIRLDVEVDEQEEVAGEQPAAEECCTLSAGASAHIRQVGPVSCGEVGVR